MQGYLDTDGHVLPNGWNAISTSRALAYGVRDLAQTLGMVAAVSYNEASPTKVIEGRTVNQRNYWQIRAFYGEVSKKSRVRHNMLLRTVQRYIPAGEAEVFNIEVADDHSYVLDGAIVHNCQSFSIAGLRKGIADPRGGLILEYVRIVDAIDQRRPGNECIAVWENVPGVLTSKDNAFGCFLAALAGEAEELVPAPRLAGGKSNRFWNKHSPRWPKSGCVLGPQRAVAWRTFDAQFFGVAQRRRRVFVVASARDGFDPAAVLFEWEGVRRDTPPSREAGQSVAGTVAGGARKSGGYNTDDIPLAVHDIVATLDASYGKLQGASGQDANHGHSHLVMHGTQDPDVLRDMAHTLGRNSGQENAVVSPLLEVGKRTGKSTTDPRAGLGVGGDGDPMYTLQAGAQHGVAISVALRGRAGGATAELGDDVAGCLRASTGGGDKPHVLSRMAVRRLMPVECERLQGFPDKHTAIPGAKDGPRYKAIGNSMAVPCMAWIGRRICLHLQHP